MSPGCKWLIEPEVFQEDCKPLLAVLKRLRIEHEICLFGRDYDDYITDKEDCVVFYGSLQFARLIQRKAKWIPGVYCNLPQFECTYYYPRFGKFLLNSEYLMLPFGEIQRRKDWVFDLLQTDGNIFIRPSTGFKSFTGQVVSSQDVDMVGMRCNPEAIIIAHKPIKVVREWRTVVAEGEIIAASQYKIDGEVVKAVGAPKNVLEFGEMVLNSVRYQPDPVWTLDICETESGELKVLEVGSFSCCGLYACDPVSVVSLVSRIAVQEWEEMGTMNI